MDTPSYTLVRSDRKTLAIQITRDLQTVVRAPRAMRKEEIDRHVEGRFAWIARAVERMRARADARPPLAQAEVMALKKRARDVIPGRVAHYAALLNLVPAGIKITSAATRFGSCSAQNSLCFSYHLMRYPMEAVDYVVAHEVAHIAHKNHGPAFYALVASAVPDYKARRALLRG